MTTLALPVTGVMVTGGTLLTDILELLGLCTDSTKDNDNTLSLPVLGPLVTVHLKQRSVTTQVAPQKATKWADLLEQQRLQSEMSSTMALKMAGRLGSAVTSSLCKVGRAFTQALLCTSLRTTSGVLSFTVARFTLVGRLLTVSTFTSSLRGCLSSSACDSLDRRSRRIQMYSSGTRTTWSGRYFYLGVHSYLVIGICMEPPSRQRRSPDRLPRIHRIRCCIPLLRSLGSASG